MTRAVLQGVCFAFRDCQQALASAGTQLDSAYTIGGGSRSDYWVSLMASTLGIPLHTTGDGDFGASLGAVRLGLIATEECDPLSVCLPPPIERSHEPDSAATDSLLEQYHRFTETYRALKPVFSSH